MPPMVTNYGSENGFVTDQLKHYYAARARGGVGLIIVEATCVESREGKGLKRQLYIDDDSYVPGLSDLVREVKRHGAKVAIQLFHTGSEGRQALTGMQPVAPSPVPKPGGEMPRELTGSEVDALVQRFAQAAHRAKIAGFDGVEIHGAHGYLIAQFLSSFFNRRDDFYGGALEGRATFLTDIIKTTREVVGKDYPVWCRINGEEFGPEGGLSGEEAQQVARMAQYAGADAIHVSVFGYGVNPHTAPPMAQPRGNLVRFANRVKRAVTVPVIAVGRIDPEIAEAVLQDSKADLVAIGRGLIADPEIPNLAEGGKLKEARPCIGCMTCLDSLIMGDGLLQCVVNPTVGREEDGVVERAKTPKKVMIIGGGPAGMEAARVSALRGHDVVLHESGKALGGQLLLAATPPYKKSLKTFAEYQRSRLSALGVKVEMGCEVTLSLVEDAGPDVVIMATGVKPFVPPIPGVGGANVVIVDDVLEDRADVGDRVAIIGAELVGCETAEFLVDRGKEVTLIRRGDRIATKVNPRNRMHLLARLSAKGVSMMTGVQYQEINEKGVVITTREGKTDTVRVDTVVLAAGSLADRNLYREIDGKVPELYRIGDCVAPRDIRAAVTEGYFTARGI